MGAPSIEGTYQFVRRELPDGTIQHPPTVKGLWTFTRQLRNFSVVWQDEQGRYFSICYAARYSLTETEYTETAEYLIVDNQIEGQGIHYDLSPTTASSPVSIEGSRIAFVLPQAFEKSRPVSVEFDGAELKATGKDQFVDTWKKVS